MEGIDKYEYLKSKEARNQGIRDMLYQILIDGEKVTDKDSVWFREHRINEPNGIFQLEFGEVSADTTVLYHTINNELSHIQPGDTIARIHVRTNTEFTNPNKKSSKELMVDGMKRLRDYIKNMPIGQRPKYFMSYSHITPKFGEKYGFKVYNVPDRIKEGNGSMRFFDPNVQDQRREYLKRFKEQKANKSFKNEEEEREEEKWAKIEEYNLNQIPTKYSPDDIKLIVEPIDNLLNITDEYFEQLKKPLS